MAFVLCGLAGPAQATTLSLNWDTCTGPLVVPFTIGTGTVTANAGACGAVPAAATTWGQIKGQYRR